jgi:hypothetical protein
MRALKLEYTVQQDSPIQHYEQKTILQENYTERVGLAVILWTSIREVFGSNLTPTQLSLTQVSRSLPQAAKQIQGQYLD